jgi:hypothetical protein
VVLSPAGVPQDPDTMQPSRELDSVEGSRSCATDVVLGTHAHLLGPPLAVLDGGRGRGRRALWVVVQNHSAHPGTSSGCPQWSWSWLPTAQVSVGR